MRILKVVVTHDPERFAHHAGGFLTGRPIEHNVLASVVATLDQSESESPPLFAWVQDSHTGDVSAAVLRTPPRRLLASTMSPEAAMALMPSLLEADPGLLGVNGVEPAASYLAEAWQRVAGGSVAIGMSQAIHWLEHVSDLSSQPHGYCRPAHRSDRDLLIKWTHAFSREADPPGLNVEPDVERRLRHGHLYVWEDDQPTSMVGRGPSIAGVVRLGPVYTPPEARRHGYATALVAEVSRRALALDATKCMLYTDLANLTSNSIYQAIGYQRSHHAQEYLFTPAAVDPPAATKSSWIAPSHHRRLR